MQERRMRIAMFLSFVVLEGLEAIEVLEILVVLESINPDGRPPGLGW